MKHEIVGYNNHWRLNKNVTPFPYFGLVGEAANGLMEVRMIGTEPKTHYMAVEQCHFSLLYDGTSKSDAEAAQRHYERDGEYSTSHIKEYVVLEKGTFRLIQLKNTGQVIVINGEDTSDRCFLMGGCTNLYAKMPRLMREATTANVLHALYTGDYVDFIAILKKGERVVFEGTEPNHNGEIFVEEFIWDGQYINQKRTPRSEWEIENKGIAVVEGLDGLGREAAKL